MNTLAAWHPGGWLVKATWQASLLIVMVLLVQWLLRKQLAPRWRYSLWLLVVARLVLPVSLESGLSVFNVFKNIRPAIPAPLGVAQGSSPDRAIIPNQASGTVLPTGSPQPVVENASPADAEMTMNHLVTESKPAPASPTPVSRFAAIRAVPWSVVALAVWLAGALALPLHLLVSNHRLARKVSAQRPVMDTAVLELLEDCKQIMAVRSPIQIVEMREVAGPALYGFIRPRLLLPEGLLQRFSHRELRYVFLHELAHIKRHDIVLNWLMTALQALHWFNPCVWFAFHRMRADRELACDALALGHVREEEVRPYGHTIIKLLEGFSRPVALPGLVGILEDKKQMAERIRMIKLFTHRQRWPMLAALLLPALAIVGLTDAQTASKLAAAKDKVPRPDLVGKVHGADGSIISATVFVFSAGPKTGTSPYCPTCYVDCRKQAKTDAKGNFKIESLDPQLIFRILVVAKDHQPEFVPSVDPAGTNLGVTLQPFTRADAPPDQRLVGRVVDAKGKPVHGAVIQPVGIHYPNGRNLGGILSDVDPLAVSDENGEFLITAKIPFVCLDLNVEARAFARQRFAQVTPGNQRHDLVLSEGSGLTGRVLWQGKPLANVTIGVSGLAGSPQNEARSFPGHYEVATDASGRFLISNLPANAECNLFGRMEGLQSKGAITIRQVATGKDAELVEVGDLAVGPAHRLAGQVVLDGGGNIPPKTRLLINRPQVWDSMFVDLPPDGRFDLASLPPETFSLSISVPGYRISGKNASRDTLNAGRLLGRVDRDITNLSCLLEPGRGLPGSSDPKQQEADHPVNRPLRGVEAADVDVGRMAVSGRVQDADTGALIPKSRVTTGATLANHSEASWDLRGAIEATNGNFLVYFEPRGGSPGLKVEADGYLPAATGFTGGRTNFDVRLQRGSGPVGRLLLPDGNPAADVVVMLICSDGREVRLDSGVLVPPMPQRGRATKTGLDGRFQFAADLGMRAIAVAAPDGFKVVSVADLAASQDVRLDAWARVKGTFKRASGPGAAEDLDLSFVDDMLPNRMGIRAMNHVVTDAAGNFEFDRVPPGRLRVTYRTRLNENGYTVTPLRQFDLKPGQTLELNLDAVDRPAGSVAGTTPSLLPEAARKPGRETQAVAALPEAKTKQAD